MRSRELKRIPQFQEMDKGGGYEGQRADLWSCGCILYTMLSGSMAFSGENFAQLVMFICTVEPYYPASIFSDDAVDLMCCLLRKSPMDRATTADVRRHPWFTSGGDYKARGAGGRRRRRWFHATTTLASPGYRGVTPHTTCR